MILYKMLKGRSFLVERVMVYSSFLFLVEVVDIFWKLYQDMFDTFLRKGLSMWEVT